MTYCRAEQGPVKTVTLPSSWNTMRPGTSTMGTGNKPHQKMVMQLVKVEVEVGFPGKNISCRGVDDELVCILQDSNGILR